MFYIGIDIGGTNTSGGVVNESGVILARENIKTCAPRDPESICKDIKKMCMSLCKKAGISFEEIERIGVGAPGVIHDGIIEYARYLNFENVDFASMLTLICEKKVILLNDGNAAAYGEFIMGAGKSHHSLVMLTIGTGIGGGIIINDKIYTGFNGAGAEMGHIVINADGELCKCGKRGCFELYCSANALVDSAINSMQNNKDSIMWELCSYNLENVNGHTPFDAMRRGDKAAKEVVQKFIKYLSIGILNIISFIQPEVVCIGGGISAEGDAITTPLTEYIGSQSYIHEDVRRTKILAALLANDAGIIGAAMYNEE